MKIGFIKSVILSAISLVVSYAALGQSAPTLSLSAASTHVPVVQCTSATDVFTVTTGGSFAGNVNFTVAGLPSGVTGSWSSNPITPVSGTGSSTLKLAASTAATVNWFTFTVTAAGDGLSVTWTYTVEIEQAPGMTMQVSNTALSMTSLGSTTETVTATPFGGAAAHSGASGATAAIVSGLPSGVTASWSSPTVNGAGAVNWTLTLSGSPTAIGSSSALVLSEAIPDASNGKTYSGSQGPALSVAFVSPTLSFSPASTHIPVVQGAGATDVFTVATGGSFHGNVTFTVAGLPSGVTGSWSSNPITPVSGKGSATLTLSATTTAAVNWFTFTVTAAGDGLSVTWTYTVEVEQAPGMTMQVSNTALSMTSLGSTTETVTATPFGGAAAHSGASGATAAIVSGLPGGVTASWSSPTVNGAGAVSWTLTLSGSPTAVGSSGALVLSETIPDASNGKTYSGSQSPALKVAFVSPTLSFSPALTHVPVVQGTSATDLFTVATGGSFHGNVTFTVAGLPSGVTESWSGNPITPVSGKCSSTLTLSASTAAIVNWFTFTVTAAGDGLSVTWTYTVEVEPATGVQVQLSLPALSIQSNAVATIVVTALPQNGVTVPAGAVGASAAVASGLPSGFSASWSSPSVTGSGAVNWTLTITSNTTSLTGSYPIALTVRITDKTSGVAYSAGQSFPLLVSLLANMSIGTTPGTSIPPTFMGLSHEWSGAQNLMGDSASGVNTIYRQLLSNLTAYGSGPFNVRVGGLSTDNTGEPTSTTAAPFAQLAQALGARFELGVNLGADNPNLATDQATAYLSQMPTGSVNAIEIGNEPDLYVASGIRPAGYTVQDYFADFNTWEEAITPVLPSGTKFMGPSWTTSPFGMYWGSSGMLAETESFDSEFATSLSTFSQHFYATSPLDNPAVDFLLTPGAATQGPSGIAAEVAAAHSNGAQFRLGEFNTVSDAGIEGISNAFGSALWAVDAMFGYANVGVDGVNWEANAGNYDSPFDFNITTSNGVASYSLTSVNPVYYGMLLFQAATGNGAKLLPVSFSTPANLTAWATIDASSVPRLVIINKDESLSGTVEVTMPGYTQASILRLSAPSYTSTSGVTLGGQTFEGSSNGKIQGTQALATIEGNNGVFQLPMPITSAALVVFSN
jgi:hypothetical protein